MKAMSTIAVQEKCDRLEAVALPGRIAVHRNEILRAAWRRLRTEAVSAVPADRPRRRLR
jgi:hypothetical protein